MPICSIMSINTVVWTLKVHHMPKEIDCWLLYYMPIQKIFNCCFSFYTLQSFVILNLAKNKKVVFHYRRSLSEWSFTNKMWFNFFQQCEINARASCSMASMSFTDSFSYYIDNNLGLFGIKKSSLLSELNNNLQKKTLLNLTILVSVEIFFKLIECPNF